MNWGPAVVGGYSFEGRVGLEAVEKVLKVKPQIAGLAAPDMTPCAPRTGDDHKAV